MDITARKKKFLLLQINDALFPIGAYSHSYGLETYIQKNLVTNAEQAADFIYTRLKYAFCTNEFLTAKLAFQYAADMKIDLLDELEEYLEASRIPKEIREAGKKLGSRFVKTLMRLDIPYENNSFLKYVEARKGKTIVHACVYGVFCAAAGINYEEAMEHFLYAQASSMVTNCVKTIPLSQTAGQTLLYQCENLFHEILQELEQLTIEDLCRSTPGFDIRCMQHESLYSRIYMS